MKFLTLIILFFLCTCTWAKGCFREPVLNELVAKQLHMNCEAFPDTVDVRSLETIYIEKDVNLYEEDLKRLTTLTDFELSCYSHPGLTVKLWGDLPLTRLQKLRLNFPQLDASEGKLLLGPKLTELEILNYPGLIESFPKVINFSLVLTDPTKAAVMDFQGRTITKKIVFFGGHEVRNLTVRGPTFIAYGNSLLQMKNVSIEVGWFKAEGVNFDEQCPVTVTSNFETRKANLTAEVTFPPGKGFSSLSISNTKLPVTKTSDLSSLSEAYITHSEVSGIVIPVSQKSMTRLYVVDSRVTLDRMPDVRLKSIDLSGDIHFQDTSFPLRIYKDTIAVNLIGLGLKELKLELVDPSSLASLVLLGSPKVNLSVLNESLLSKVPHYFMAKVDDEGTARKIRKLFKGKSAVFQDWLPLKPQRGTFSE